MRFFHWSWLKSNMKIASSFSKSLRVSLRLQGIEIKRLMPSTVSEKDSDDTSSGEIDSLFSKLINALFTDKSTKSPRLVQSPLNSIGTSCCSLIRGAVRESFSALQLTTIPFCNAIELTGFES